MNRYRIYWTESTRAPVGKRYASCWGTVLDCSGTDSATQCLRDKGSRNQLDVRTGPGRTDFRSCAYEAVTAYYCVNHENSYGNADLEDVNYGLAQMDAACPIYMASFFEWDGTVRSLARQRRTRAFTWVNKRPLVFNRPFFFIMDEQD